MFICICFAFILLGARLGWLQLVRGEAYAARAESQSVSAINLKEYARGNFWDCNSRKLTGRKMPALVVFPTMVKDEDAANYLSNILNLTEAEIASKLAKCGSKPFILARNLTNEQTEALAISTPDGFFVIPMEIRYSSTARASHLIGFVGESGPEEIASGVTSKIIGKSGLEKQYENYLQGGTSAKAAMVLNESGEELLESLMLIPAPEQDTSCNVVLTINRDYQEIAEQAFAGKSGAVVIMDVQNGDVLAMVSAPEYDQNLGQVGGISGDSYINKALVYYPPASVFKIILAAAALDLQIKTDDDFMCNGGYELSNGHIVSCWKEEGHGKEDIGLALANSCNPYFTDLGQKLGGETIIAYANKFGLREQKLIGYSLPAYYKTINFNPGVVGDVANASIGEKGIRLSPLMVAQMFSVVANGGISVTPRVVKAIVDQNGSTIKSFASVKGSRAINDKTAAELKSMLTLAVTGGTGTNAANNVVSTAGKTGTSQEQGVWFAGFAPAEDPRWAVAVYVQNGNSGGRDGAVPFREIVSRLAILEGI
jgi:cell division protein FtsI/penicillin-binding protein 2